MGTETEEEQEIEEEEEEETSPQQSEDNKLIRSLRKKLRDSEKQLRELGSLKEVNAFLSAGLGDLSEERKTALKAVAGEDLTKETLLAKAKLLGFTSATTSDNGEQEQIDKEVQTINETESAVSKSSAKPDNRDFVTRIKEAKSQDEVMALLASEGEEHGLLVEEF